MEPPKVNHKMSGWIGMVHCNESVLNKSTTVTIKAENILIVNEFSN